MGSETLIGSSEFRNGKIVKKLIVYDLDGTLAESKSSLDTEMSALLHDLLGIVKVAVISGGDWPQFEKQLLSDLPHDDRLVNLSLLPTCGTKFYQYAGEWKKIYEEDFTPAEKEKIVSSLTKALSAAGLQGRKDLGKGNRRPGKPDHIFRFRSAGAPGRKGQMGSRLHQAEEDQSNP